MDSQSLLPDFEKLFTLALITKDRREDKEIYSSLFEKFALTDTRKMSKGQFQNLLLQYRSSSAEHSESSGKIFDILDCSRKGYITCSMFTVGMYACSPKASHSLNTTVGNLRCAFLFQYYDEDRDRKLNQDELRNFLTDLRRPHCRDAHLNLQKLVDAAEKDAIKLLQAFKVFTYEIFLKCISEKYIMKTEYLFRFERESEKELAHLASNRPEENSNLLYHANQSHTNDFTSDFPSSIDESNFNEKIATDKAEDLEPGVTAATKTFATIKDLSKTWKKQKTKREEKQNDYDCFFQMDPKLCKALCQSTRDILAKENALLELDCPVVFFGNINGSLLEILDFLRHKELLGDDLQNTYFKKIIFCGNIVDTGSHSLEVLALIFSLKILFPELVYLLKGPHETRHENMKNQFIKQLQYHYVGTRDFDQVTSVWEEFNATFDYMSFAAIVNGLFLCIHGGIENCPDSVYEMTTWKKPLSQFGRSVWKGYDRKRNSEGRNSFANPQQFTMEGGAIKQFLQKNQLGGIITTLDENSKAYSFDTENCVYKVNSSGFEHNLNKAATVSIDSTSEGVSPSFLILELDENNQKCNNGQSQQNIAANNSENDKDNEYVNILCLFVQTP